MLKRILAALLACGTIAACVSCGNNVNTPVDQDGNNDGVAVENAPEQTHFQMIVKDYPVGLTDRDTGRVYSEGVVRKASFVAFDRINSPISKKMSATLKTAYDRNVAASDELLTILQEAFATEGFDPETAMFPWHVNTNYELIRNDGKVVTVKETIDYFAGGPHNATVSTYYYNFNALTGDLISQVLYAEGDDKARDAADDMIYNKLKDKYGEDVISYDYVEASFVESAIDSWYFTENGVNLYFNLYEIAPFAAGDFEIEITKDELPEFALAYFLK